VQAAFGTVLWVVCGVAAVVAVVCLARSGKTWEEYRERGMVMERDAPRGPAPGSATANAERDAEIREMLKARNERRLRRGEAPVDVEQELARLTAAASPRFAAGETGNAGEAGTDPALREEIRQLVIARNHRRISAGKPPLDVAAEIEREINDFGQGLR
jgi:hypothetical protein